MGINAGILDWTHRNGLLLSQAGPLGCVVGAGGQWCVRTFLRCGADGIPQVLVGEVGGDLGRLRKRRKVGHFDGVGARCEDDTETAHRLSGLDAIR